MSTSVAAEFATANEGYVKNLTDDKKFLPLPPARKVLVVTCMDARIDPAQSLGISEGDAHVVRNAGGRATDALRSIIISQQLLGTREIALYHHTDCGMLTFSDQVLRDQLKAHAPDNAAQIDQIAFLPFSNIEKSVKEDVKLLQDHPLVLKETKISGWIHDVQNGKVSQVV